MTRMMRGGRWSPLNYTIGSFIGGGIGMGLFSSIWFFFGVNGIFGPWYHCLDPDQYEGMCLDTCGKVSAMILHFVCRLFITLIAIPFTIIPAVIGLAMWNFLIPLVGYGTPLLCFMVLYKKCRVQSDGAQSVPAVIELVALQTQSQSPKKDEIQERMTGIDLMALNGEIQVWLSGIGLMRYYGLLKQNGYETMADLQTITAADLKKVGITKQRHIKKMLSGKGWRMLRVVEE